MHKLVLFICLISIYLSACTQKNTEEIMGQLCDTSSTKFSTHILPAITTRCNSQSFCHGSPPMGSVPLNSHAQITIHANRMLERMIDGSMPPGGPKVDDCLIQRFTFWINQGKPNN